MKTKLKEITLARLKPAEYIRDQVAALRAAVGDGIAINALSGGVDSSVVTLLAHRALGARLKTYFIDNGLMRAGEPQTVVKLFRQRGVPVELVDARREFFAELKGKTDPEAKRQAITHAFYKKVFGRLVRRTGARFLLHGTILTDVEETVAGIKRQHNILSQLGIDTRKAYGYTVLEPLINLRKPAVRRVGRALGLPAALCQRPPFPGPALAARVIGEVTPAEVELVRQATAVVERVLARVPAFQCLAILHADRVTGIRAGRRDFGRQIEVRCWDSRDAVTARPTHLPYKTLVKLGDQITREVPGVVSVTYNITAKPPSTIEAI